MEPSVYSGDTSQESPSSKTLIAAKFFTPSPSLLKVSIGIYPCARAAPRIKWSVMFSFGTSLWVLFRLAFGFRILMDQIMVFDEWKRPGYGRGPWKASIETLLMLLLALSLAVWESWRILNQAESWDNLLFVYLFVLLCTYVCTLDILFCQISTFMKVWVWPLFSGSRPFDWYRLTLYS